MIKTQVQIPDHLHKEAKRIAEEYEMSFAEVVRRGLERLAPCYPPRNKDANWAPPKPRRLGCRDLSPEQLRDCSGPLDAVPEWFLSVNEAGI